jgi:hypothetical protein
MFVLISPPGALFQHQQGGWDQLSRLWGFSSTNDNFISDAHVHEKVQEVGNMWVFNDKMN